MEFFTTNREWTYEVDFTVIRVFSSQPLTGEKKCRMSNHRPHLCKPFFVAFILFLCYNNIYFY